jgi:hypothetical protein
MTNIIHIKYFRILFKSLFSIVATCSFARKLKVRVILQMLWKVSLNSDGQQFYQQNIKYHLSPPIMEHKNTTTYMALEIYVRTSKRYKKCGELSRLLGLQPFSDYLISNDHTDMYRYGCTQEDHIISQR